ncbi:MAG: hypothetical protein Q8R24_10870 [Legionellaceae bacterium]|nr:hypothetical protein [Legionellaceae bacterium]
MNEKKYANLSLFTSETTHLAKMDKRARDVLHMLQMGYQSYQHWEHLQTIELCRAVFLKRDQVFQRAMRKGFRDAFQDIFLQLSQLDYQHFNPDNKTDAFTIQHNKHVFSVSRLLSSLPYADIKPDDKFKIPEWDALAKTWNLVKYEVSAIELTPTWGVGALVLDDNERVFAYGLTPMHGHHRHFRSSPQPHLIFPGTTYPAGQGFTSQVFANLEWFSTPGSQSYHNSKSKIRHWLEKSTIQSKAKARVHGDGLGGSTSYFPALDAETSAYISHVFAHNPPGLCETMFTNYQEKWDQLMDNDGERPEVYILLHEHNSMSSYFGSWLKGWHVLNAATSEQLGGSCDDLTHASRDTHLPHEEFIEVSDIDAENKRRWWFNLGVNTVLRSLVFGLLALPCHYLVIPICRAVLNHKLELVIVAAIAMTFMLFSGLLASPMGIAAMAAASAYLAYKFIEPMKKLIGFVKEPSCHETDAVEMKRDLHDVLHAPQLK